MQYTPLERLRALEQQAWEAGQPHATVLTLRRIWTEGGTLYETRDNAVVGDPPLTSLEEVVAQIVREETEKEDKARV